MGRRTRGGDCRLDPVEVADRLSRLGARRVVSERREVMNAPRGAADGVRVANGARDDVDARLDGGREVVAAGEAGGDRAGDRTARTVRALGGDALVRERPGAIGGDEDVDGRLRVVGVGFPAGEEDGVGSLRAEASAAATASDRVSIAVSRRAAASLAFGVRSVACAKSVS